MRDDPRARKPVGACRSSFRISGIRGADLRLSDEQKRWRAVSTGRRRAKRPRPRCVGFGTEVQGRLSVSRSDAQKRGVFMPRHHLQGASLVALFLAAPLGAQAADAAPTTVDDLIVTGTRDIEGVQADKIGSSV